MKKLVFVLAIVAMLATASVATANNGNGKFASCTTIQNGVLTYSAGHYLAGELLEVGYDPYGYNYQATRFRGTYCNVHLGSYGYPPSGTFPDSVRETEEGAHREEDRRDAPA